MTQMFLACGHITLSCCFIRILQKIHILTLLYCSKNADVFHQLLDKARGELYRRGPPEHKGKLETGWMLRIQLHFILLSFDSVKLQKCSLK